jgi:hypothetical protein
MLNKKERIEFLEQNYFFEIANNKIAELDREYSFIDYERLVETLDEQFAFLLKALKSFMKTENIELNCWRDVFTSEDRKSNEGLKVFLSFLNSTLKVEIYRMFIEYTVKLKSDVFNWVQDN